MKKSDLVEHKQRSLEEVSDMFDKTSENYDLLNFIFSFGMDGGWRRKAVREALRTECRRVLDVCTGTGETAIALAKNLQGGAQINGVDFSRKSLERGREKILDQGLAEHINLSHGDATDLPFADGTFDAVTITFGLRNLSDREKGLKEFLRVTRPEGCLVCLEFSHPPNRVVAASSAFYIHKVIPQIARLFRTDGQAYYYLGETIRDFPDAPKLAGIIESTGWEEVSYKYMGLGGVAIHYAIKKIKSN